MTARSTGFHGSMWNPPAAQYSPASVGSISIVAPGWRKPVTTPNPLRRPQFPNPNHPRTLGRWLLGSWDLNDPPRSRPPRLAEASAHAVCAVADRVPAPGARRERDLRL